MSTPEDTAIDHEYAAVGRSVREAREAVAEFAERHGVTGERLDDIRTAVSEAATNVVVHAYDRDTAGCFRLLAVTSPGQLLVIIDDDGCGFDAPAQDPGLGLGRRVMEESSEHAMFLTRDIGGSSVQLRFKLDR